MKLSHFFIERPVFAAVLSAFITIAGAIALFKLPVAEYPEVSPNLYIRVLQELERNSDAGLVLDLASDPEGGLKVLEKVKQAVPDLYVIASNYHAEAETVCAIGVRYVAAFRLPDPAVAKRGQARIVTVVG